MNILKIITLITFAVEFLTLGIGMACSFVLFSRLEKMYPKYYKSIGKPKALGYARNFPTTADYMQRLRGGAFVYSLAFKGLSVDFPKDHNMRRLAIFIRRLFLGIITIFFALVLLFYTAFK